MKRGDALKAIVGTSIATIAGCGYGTPAVDFSRGSPNQPTLFGSQIYEVDPINRAIAMIAGCGGTYIRVSSQVTTSYLDAVAAAAIAHGMRIILISPYASQPVDIEAYVASTVALQTRYAAINPIWEIWNEPNLEAYWGAAPSIPAYLRLLVATAGALRAAGADDVWSGGTSGVDLHWLYELASNGAFAHVNGCAV